MTEDSYMADDGFRRELVVWTSTGRWRWVLVGQDGVIAAGWSDSKQAGMVAVALARNPNPVPHIQVKKTRNGGI